MGQLRQGISYFFKGFSLLGHSSILPFVVLPVLINLLLAYFGYQYLTETFSDWITSFSGRIPQWLGFIETMLVWLFRIILLLVFAFTFTFFANLIGSPFYGLMAEQVEALNNSNIDNRPFSWKELIRLIPRSILRELQKLLYYLLRALPLLILSLLSIVISPLAAIMPLLWFMFGATMLTIQYVDYSYDNHNLPFKKLKRDLKQTRMVSWSFGGMCTLAAMVPLLNVVAVPAAVCGGTLYFVERLQKNAMQ